MPFWHCLQLCLHHGELISLLEEQKAVKNLGASMRLGAYPCRLTKRSHSYKAYGKDSVSERHRHRYEFNNKYKKYYFLKIDYCKNRYCTLDEDKLPKKLMYQLGNPDFSAYFQVRSVQTCQLSFFKNFDRGKTCLEEFSW